MTRISMLAIILCVVPSVAPQFALPDGVVPRKHVIEMTIDPARDTFSGVAKIDLTLRAAQSVIWLNGKDLTVSEASVEAGGKKHLAKTETAGGEFIGITPPEPVGPGDVTVSIRYQAPLSTEAVSGPYRRNVDGEWYQFTVFTPIDARRAFPCFDEPRFKTPWEMAIHVRREHRAFANAPIVAETDEPDGMKRVQFAPTPPLPAEIVAFAVGPFDVWDGGKAGARQTPVRVITPKGQAEQGKQAALVTQEVLPRLERYTGIPYPWDKLDHIALPQGAFGATENPGLITYLSRSLLIPPGILPSDGSEDRRRPLRGLQAHEIGHQWFGNLVTQADWTDVWLSEGFATWFAAKIMDEEQPVDRKHLGAVAARERIMATDESPQSHPVRWPIHNREELKSVYNQVAYQKGGAVLLMLESWLGEDRFQQGLRKYLGGHRMGNATTRDLEAALRTSAATDPTPVMEAFLNTTGVPSIAFQCEPSKIVVERHASQPVPICWKTVTATSCKVIEQPIDEIALPAGSPCPVYWNADGAGYYRTSWTGTQLQALASQGLGQLNGAERLTLVYDLRALRKSGKLDAAATDPLLNVLANDAQPEILHAAKVALGLETEPAPRRR